MVRAGGALDHRCMLTKRIARMLALALVVASCAAPVSAASATAWNDRWGYLRFPASTGYGGCVYRDIYLAAGTYGGGCSARTGRTPIIRSG